MTWQGAWPSQPLKQSRDSLLELRAIIDTGQSLDAGVLAQLARFLAIRSTGHVEFTFDKCLEHYAGAKSHPNVAGYVTSTLFRGKSVKPKVLVDRLRDVNSAWANDLDGFLCEDDERLSRELDFMVEKRNKIAHGQNHGLGTRKALDISDVSIAIGDWLVARMDPRDNRA